MASWLVAQFPGGEMTGNPVHSGTNRPVGSFSRSLRMNESYGAISLPGNEQHI